MTLTMKNVPHQGRHMRGAVIVCGHCGVTKTLPINRFANCRPADQEELEQQFAKRKLEEEGWLVGKKESAHRCPGCYSAIKARQAIKSENKENVVVLPTKPEAPREMSREDRRIIFEKLNEVYVDERTGYGHDWTDAKVASDLGVPRAWVRALRDEMFGPEGSNEEIRSTIAEATTLLHAIKGIAASIEQTTAPLKTLLDKAGHIEKRVAEIQQELR